MTKFNAAVSILWLAVSLYGQPARSTKPELESAAVSIPPLRCRAERPRNSYTGHIRLAQCFGHGRLTAHRRGEPRRYFPRAIRLLRHRSGPRFQG